MQGWILEQRDETGGIIVHPIVSTPYTVGRDSSNSLVIASVQTSRHHARLDEELEGHLRLTDLNSGNGTFVNRRQIHGSTLLSDGDIIHFGVAEFRFRKLDAEAYAKAIAPADGRTVLVDRLPPLSEHFLLEEKPFREMLRFQSLAAALQPIVHIEDGRLHAFELLGRGKHEKLPHSPIALFRLASQLGSEIELSEAFRTAGFRAIAEVLPGGTFFLNAHPAELFTERFLASLRLLRAMMPTAELVVEVHETAVARIEDMRELAQRLAALSVRFAYDDFGAGQARLNELAEVPPHYVKFDMALIRNIHEASPRKQELLAQLVRIVRACGARALAEGVERGEEALICRQMGFDLVQGYLTGRPEPILPPWPYPLSYRALALA
ncbi:MAG: EAL domain-containing protein [Casimicrobiaceae bacterium]|nr:EAL domain-containing protein [Casimicrobiaceae bacterium]MDW8312380.1 EAL domain-containing protein [Burkholderiales bacterium]